MASDPLIWTPSAVKAELMRILGVLDTVNLEVSAASGAGKISSAEWSQWRQAYLAGHTFVTNASTFWGSNVVTARQHEQEAGKWRALVISRGGQTQGPSNLVRVPDSGSFFSINLSTIALVVGGGALALYLMSMIRKVAPMAGAAPAILTFEDLVRHKFRSKKQGYSINWYPMTCRTAEKFLHAQGIDMKAPRPGYEIEVKSDRGVTTVLTNRGGRCEFTFRQRRETGRCT